MDVGPRRRRPPATTASIPAIVTNLVDPPRQGQVQVRFPSLGTRRRHRRTRLGQPVLAVRRRRARPGDPAGGRHPGAGGVRGRAVRRALHPRRLLERQGRAAGEARPRPTTCGCCESRADSTLTFDDTAGAEKVTLTMKSGHQIELDNQRGEVVIRHAKGPVITMTSGRGDQDELHDGRRDRGRRSTCTPRPAPSTASSTARR